jgi:4-amino-4-deoxy-L-arabinose transferase-like glycosyltransferase
MTLSWKNFFFGAFDPGGFITVDKPPVFLWAGALSARVFGYSSWSLLLPSAFAGAASVALLWLLVRRYFGVWAGTIAGLALALTPISVAVDRLNLPEPFMILALVGAAGALLQSFESRRWWAWVSLAGFLVGVAFNTKMLAAWIPGPAFALALVVATRAVSPASAKQLLARLAVLGAVTLVVSGSWTVIVDAWPASDRPYIGGSTDNTVLDLALGYNGFGRVDGDSQGGGGGGGRGVPNFRGPAGGGGFNGPGGIVAGTPGPWRMFDASNGDQIAWLLPFAIGSGLVALWYWRRDPTRRAFAVLFLGWVALYGVVFSYAQGIFHTYYTSAMAPGIAALTGVGVVTMAHAVRRDRRWLAVAIALICATVWVQLDIAGRTPDFYGWLRPPMWLAALAGIVATCALAARRRSVVPALALSVGGLMLLPAAWSISAAANTSLNATLPQAGPRQGAAGQTFGSAAFDDGTGAMAAWLESHPDPDATWQLVVPNSQSGSRLIAQYGISVMSLGGFLGQDPTISVAGFADLVSSGEVRYVLVSSGGPGGGGFPRGGVRGGPTFGARGSVPAADASGANAVLSAVRNACTVVADPSLPTQYRGSMYDCSGAGGRLVRGR